MDASVTLSFSGGDGSAGNPFQISNISQLQNISGNLSAHYVLINDIDATATKSWNSGLGFLPIGNDTNPEFEEFNGTGFMGSLDGRGYKIIGLFINRPIEAYIGLFGQINNSAQVKNVHLRDTNLTGNHSIGGLSGSSDGGIVINCSATGHVYGNRFLGGLLGKAGHVGLVMACSAASTIVGVDEYLGGVLGYNAGQVINCHAHGDTTGDLVVGGLLGENGITGLVRNCSVSGNTSAQYLYAGGLAGYNYGQIINCMAYGDTYGDMMVGGLVGENTISGEITACQRTGNINGTGYYIGGVVGENYGSVRNCSTYGLITGNGLYVGGVVGENIEGGIVSNCSSYIDTTGYSEVGGSVGSNYGAVANCSVFGNTSGDDSIGGIVGYNSGVLATSYSTGGAGGYSYIGGVVGYNSGIVHDCYSQSKIIGDDFVGGGIGINSGGTVKNCYTTGHVVGNANVGGFIGNNTGTVANCFWDRQTSGQSTSAGGAGKYTAELMTKGTFTSAGWDFIAIWGVGEGGTYPFFLKWYTPPSITTVDVKTGKEGAFYYVNYDAHVSSYPAGNEIYTWLVKTDAGSWLCINSNGVLSGRPGNSAVGEHWVNVTVLDLCKRIHSHNFTLNITNVNDAPVIITKALPAALEDQLYGFKLAAIDADPTGDIFNWSMTSNGSWLSINSTTGNLSGLPTNQHVGSCWVNVTVDDGHNGTDFAYFIIEVINVNDDPVITTIDNVTMKFGEQYWVDYEAEDIDATGDVLTWYLHTNASWLELTPEDGILSGTPISRAGGTYWVNVSVFDGNSGSDWHNFTLTVLPGALEPNQKPVITTSDVTSGEVGSEYRVEYSATDDRTLVSQLVWSMSTNASWLSFNPGTRVLFGIPGDSDFGNFWVNITVVDGDGGAAFHNFTVIVPKPYIPPVNNKPKLTNGQIVPKGGDTDTEFNFTVHYFDADDDPPFEISVVLDGVAYNMTLISGFATNGTYGYLTKLSAGVHKYYFWATDGKAGCDAGDLTTPINASGARTTAEVTEVDGDNDTDDKSDGESDDNSMLYLVSIIVIILIVVIVLLALVLSRGKRAPRSMPTEIGRTNKPALAGQVGQPRHDWSKPKSLAEVMGKERDLGSNAHGYDSKVKARAGYTMIKHREPRRRTPPSSKAAFKTRPDTPNSVNYLRTADRDKNVLNRRTRRI